MGLNYILTSWRKKTNKCVYQNVEIEINTLQRMSSRLTRKKRILWPSAYHVERKPILTLFTTNSTFHSFYSLSWQLLPTRGNSLKSNCQESTALVFRESGRERQRECERKRERASYGGRNVEAQQVALSNSRGLPCWSLPLIRREGWHTGSVGRGEDSGNEAEGEERNKRERRRAKWAPKNLPADRFWCSRHTFQGMMLVKQSFMRRRWGGWRTSNWKLWRDRLLGEAPQPTDSVVGLFLVTGSAVWAQGGAAPTVWKQKSL